MLQCLVLGCRVRLWCIFVFVLRFLFLCNCACFKGVGFRFWCLFFGFSTWGFFFYITLLGLRVSGFGSDVSFWFFDMRLLFLCYYASFKGVSLGSDIYFFGFSTWGFFFYVTALGFRMSRFASDVLFWFFNLRLLFLCNCALFKSVGFRFWCSFLVFRPEVSFSMLLYLVLGCRV